MIIIFEERRTCRSTQHNHLSLPEEYFDSLGEKAVKDMEARLPSSHAVTVIVTVVVVVGVGGHRRALCVRVVCRSARCECMDRKGRERERETVGAISHRDHGEKCMQRSMMMEGLLSMMMITERDVAN